VDTLLVRAPRWCALIGQSEPPPRPLHRRPQLSHPGGGLPRCRQAPL